MNKTIKLGMEHQQFSYDKKTIPAATAASGDTLVFETEDANCGLIRENTDLWSSFAEIYTAAGGCNPVTGPVYIEGAKEGDCLAVEILDVVAGPWLRSGYTSIQSGVGVLEDIWCTLQEPLAPHTRICKFEDGCVVMGLENSEKCVKIPMTPFVGSIGVAPKYDRRASFYQGAEWCGNIDIPAVRAGATVVLPVNVDGALLSIGDVHACQGDGEITGCALECQGTVTVRVTVLPHEAAHFVGCTQINTAEMIGSVGMPDTSDLTHAMKRGYTDLVRRMEKEFGISQPDGYMLLGLAGKVQIGNENTCLCSISRGALLQYQASAIRGKASQVLG